MSAASKSKARALVRHREQVARAIVAKAPLYWAHSGKACAGLGAVPGLLGPDPTHTFDVHAAREHAAALIALEAEHDAFADWTREQGLGPENREAGAFAPTAEHVAMRIARGQTTGLSKLAPFHRRGGWPGKLARLGRRILDILDGERGRPESAWLHAPYQPSECQAGCCVMAAPAVLIDEEGNRVHVRKGQRVHIPGETEPRGSYQPGQVKLGCPDCRGTGHNLRGELPPVEWSPQMLRKAADCDAACMSVDSAHRVAQHLLAPLEQLGLRGASHWLPTRSVPRGEHRLALVERRKVDLRDQRRGADLTSSVLRGRSRGRDESRRFALLPSHERGRIRHAEQRRAKRDPEA